jgi:hypothetical protein
MAKAAIKFPCASFCVDVCLSLFGEMPRRAIAASYVNSAFNL